MAIPRTARALLLVAVVAFGVLGAVSFLAPGWASGNFPWRVGPFTAMTIGGWSLGTAAFAWLAIRAVRASIALPLLVYLWVFAAGQLLVVVAFLDKLQTAAILTYPYLVGLGALALSALATLVDWQRRRPDLRGPTSGVRRWHRVATLAFSVAVAVIVLGTLVSVPDGPTDQGRFFPEPRSLFSIRAFSAFFFALSVSSLSLVPIDDRASYRTLGVAGLALIVPITIASLFNIGLFDFAGRPGGIVYLGAYLFVGTLLTLVLLRERGRGPRIVGEPVNGDARDGRSRDEDLRA